MTCLGESLFLFIVFGSQWVYRSGSVQETKITRKFGQGKFKELLTSSRGLTAKGLAGD